MTRHTIEMNFRQASAQASRLDEQAEAVRAIAERQLPDTMQQLSGDWSGTAAGQYLAKCEQLRQKLLNNARQLEQTADTIRRAARRLYNAEMAALRLAEERKASL
ncbi:MAG TPA: WXG100 family type VII secretion target [Candidatus Gemmiger faecigallinarum]|nr:WXG100 family type VII secretion target [Candidatus Gemmiger faecigallinarum]